MTVVQLKTKTDAEWFDEFWNVCAIKEDKIICKAKFMALISPAGLTTKIKDQESGELIPVHYEQQDPAYLVAQMAAYRKRRMGTEYKLAPFTVQPRTWLNRGRFEDD